jgi:hypothetical protein
MPVLMLETLVKSPWRPARRLSASALAACTLLAGSFALAQTHPLADTGQVICYNDSANTGTVSAGTPNPVQTGFEGQDCVRGAAAADRLDVMYKLGGSTRPGADYTRIANDGSELPSNAALGSGPGNWACTRDNVTGLVWEVKVNGAANLRHQNHSYTWYDTDASVNGGNAGTIGTNTTCNSTLTNCNTTAFRDAVNAAGLCGASDWRLPTADELQSLVHYGLTSGALIDTTWFPNTPPSFFWSGQNHALNASRAWVVGFDAGSLGPINKLAGHQVRLVRGGQ